MGGLAIGAYLASLASTKIRNPLLVYAVVEAIIGLFALFFHELFIFGNDILFNHLAVNVDSTILFTSLKWLFGIFLILPQSILLGTTFPLISSGLLKLSPLSPGKKISLLYFNNSFGAAIGALASGFIFIQTFGLPGTIITAGIINITIALVVFLIIKQISTTYIHESNSTKIIQREKFYYLMLGVAFFTGVASFFYEIAWIRMLTLVLGATTHAFELMISAFILGLAIGSFWIKKRIDHFTSPITVLAYVQILMASFAFLTLIFYGSLFDLMEFILSSLKRSEQGYTIFILTNHVLALLIMLPATIFAGMTLPLVTHILFNKHKSDKVIGHVYAVNTLGAIIGVVIAMNILLPMTGTKGLVSLGGLIDFIIGISLFGYLYYKDTSLKLKIQFIMACIFSIGVFQFSYQTSSFSPLKTSSGVFRTGIAQLSDKTKLLFHKDGKLSTVDVIESENGHTTISNNGKPDASVNIYGSTGSVDEVTMILAGTLPLAIKPNIQRAANIGMGSGQTIQALLSNKKIQHVDTIEIEKGVIEALPFFKVHSQLPRYDKRSNIIIDDAKTFFSSSKFKYDLIISEPPNLWVSGVSSLFTTEFYSQVKKKLTADGIFAQWIHLYEINIKSVSSIFKALSANFNNYVLYNTDEGNIIIIASDNYKLDNIDDSFLLNDKTKQLLQRIQINSIDGIKAHYIGDKTLLDPLFNSFSSPIASDYYPRLSYDAAKSLFLRDSASNLTSLHHHPIPIHQLIMGATQSKTLNVSAELFFQKPAKINSAKEILKQFARDDLLHKFKIHRGNQQLRHSLKRLHDQLFYCRKAGNNISIDDDIIIDSSFDLAAATAPYLGNDDLIKLWKKIEDAPCYKNITGTAKNWLTLHQALAKKSFRKALQLSSGLFKAPSKIRRRELKEYLFSGLLISAYKTNNITLAEEIWNKYSKTLFATPQDVPMSLRLLYAHIKKLTA